MKMKKKNYIYGIDGLRAIAVLMIFAYHCKLGFAIGGLLGVTVFFVISGYLITSILLKELDATNTIHLRRFWIKRLRRIMPSVLAMLAALILVSAAVNRVLFTKACKDLLSVIFCYNNWWQIFNNVSYFENAGAPSPLTHCWSLAIEMQLYLLLPLLLLLFGKFKRSKAVMIGFTFICTVLSVISMWLLFDPSKDPSRVYFGTDTRAFSLLLGALLAMLTSKSVAKTSNHMIEYMKDAVGSVSLLGLLLMMIKINGYSSFLFHGGQLLASLFALIIIYVVQSENSILGKCLSILPFRWISARSYGIYLWHFPIILLISNGKKAPWWIILLELFFSFVCAELSYRFIEQPIRYKTARKYKWRKPVVLVITAAVAACIIFVPKENVISDIQAKEEEAEKVKDLAQKKLAEQKKKTNESTQIVTEVVNETTEAVAEAVSETTEVPEPTEISETAEQQDSEEAPSFVSTTQTFSDDENTYLQNINMLLIGDSISESAADEFYASFPNGICDAAVSRYTTEAAGIYSYGYVNQGWSGDGVIFALGSNGLMYDALPQLRSAMGENQKLFVLTIRAPHVSWESSNNEEIHAFINNTPNTYLVDWYAASEGHPEYFISDDTHLTPEGQQAFVDCMKRAVLDNRP